MSKRGNPDYFKISGHVTEDPELGAQAKRKLKATQGRSSRRANGAAKANAQPSVITPPPVSSGGDVPWRVRVMHGAELSPLNALIGRASQPLRKLLLGARSLAERTELLLNRAVAALDQRTHSQH